MCWWDVKPYSINQSINQTVRNTSLTPAGFNDKLKTELFARAYGKHP